MPAVAAPNTSGAQRRQPLSAREHHPDPSGERVTHDRGPGRARIMDEAAALFVRNGYEGTSLRQIADAVGIKAGSLYYHFASKDELLTEILERGITVMDNAFDEAADSTQNELPAVRLGAHVRAHLAALFENGPYTATHVTTFRTAPDGVRESIVPWRDDYEARWTRFLNDLLADGSVASDVDINLARLSIFGAMNSSVEWFDIERGNLDAFAAAITQQFWSGVAA